MPETAMKHFVYFARDRNAVIGHSLLTSKFFSGAQIMYSWKNLEPEQDIYDFSEIRADLSLLRLHNKNLFIQIQDASFNPKFKSVPDYLLSDEYAGGVTAQYTDEGEIEGWVAKRWNKNVQFRFAKLLQALGLEFDGKVEGINLQESAIGVTPKTEPDFTFTEYVDALRVNMTALKHAFVKSLPMQYANFMPGEWLPEDNKGYLKAIFEHGQAIGVGLGSPDLMPESQAQLNHSLSLMHENNNTVPLGVAVQDGNYIGKTNTTEVVSDHVNLVPKLVKFAGYFLNVTYMFWGIKSHILLMMLCLFFVTNPFNKRVHGIVATLLPVTSALVY